MFLIDGHNLTFADPKAHELLRAGRPNESRCRVIEIVEAVVFSSSEEARIVFDGTGGGTQPPTPRGQVSYCFSGARRKADQVIERMLKDSSGRREICVVSNDHEVLDVAKKLGAKTRTAREFLAEADRAERRIAKKPPAPEPRAKRTGPAQSEVNELLAVFREEDAEAIENEEMRADGRQPGRRKH